MRLVVVAAVVACAFAAQASAQTPAPGSCSGFTSAPSMPDGATATSSAMQNGDIRFNAWLEARNSKLSACLADINALQAQLQPLQEAFNAAAAERAAAYASWSAEVEEYNSRGSSGNRRERGAARGQ